MKVTFTRDALPREGGGFKKGQTKDMADISALRWIRRGAAKAATGATTKSKGTARKKAAPKAKPAGK